MKNVRNFLIRLICLTAIFAVVFNSFNVQALIIDNSTEEQETDVYVNPEYSDIISESDFLFSEDGHIDESAEIQSVTDKTITTADQAVSLVRDIFKQRIQTGSFKVNIPRSELPEVTETRIFLRCLIRRAGAHNGIPDEGDYLMFQYGGFSASYTWYQDASRFRGTVTFQFKFYTTAKQEKTVDAWVDGVMNKLDLDGLHDIEKIRRIYKYICSNFEYDYEHLYDESDYLQYTLYGGIARGKMVCQGYSVMLYRLLLEAGVDTRVISGWGGSDNDLGRHAWNIVRLLGQYYNADCTWDADWLDYEEWYDYFLKNMSSFPKHYRGNTSENFMYDYDSAAFNNAYPMSPLNYVALKEVVMDPSSMNFTSFGVITQIPYSIVPSDATVQTVEIETADSEIIRFDEPYWISAWKNGDTTVSVTSDDGVKTAVLKAHAALSETVSVKGIYIDTNSATIKKGSTYGLSASVQPSNASDQRIYWSSSDPRTASVDENGIITAHKYGTAMITASSGNGKYKAQCTVFVYMDPERIAGSSRFQTSMKIADAYKEEKGIDQFDAVILTSGLNFADALAGSYLSYKKNAPILITADAFGNSRPYEEVNAYIRANLKAKGTVYVLGGTGAVSNTALTGLSGFTVKRLSGKGRFDTNIAILKEAGVKDEEILVATGYNFADSLSASAVNRPILLVGDELNNDQLAYLDTINTKKFCILGGTGAVKPAVEDQLEQYGTVRRLAGKGRHETSVLIAEDFCDNAERAVLAYSFNFPDGLCGGPLASAIGGPLILTSTGDKAAAGKYCYNYDITSGYVLGGSGLISDYAARWIYDTNAEIIKR